MMLPSETSEATALDLYASRLAAQGYRVLRDPDERDMPAFLEGFRPDAVALARPPKANLVVEVVHKGHQQRDAVGRVRRLRALLAGHDDWRLEILYAGVIERELPSTTPEAVQAALSAARRLSATEPRAALLLAWSALEAATRPLEPKSASRPLRAGSLVELLAAEGHILPSEADRLRELSDLRNRLAHGDLSADVTADEIREVANFAEQLLHQPES